MRINPRQLERMAKKMGMQATPIEANEVVIKTSDKEIIISNPQVSRINMMGQDTWQITGDAEERSKSPFSDDDVKMVMHQTGATEDDVRRALEDLHGDLAEAIIKLKKEKE